ncbi:hypothetical protein ACP2W0_14595 [Pseudobacillus badius]|uniref:hypothetical protein n=1 Tax=Bacillus badius TaxID=1455 RepID=UPI0007B04F9E|nr:hypothetical protein [Bacillus badius]KZN98439.1 hypothetical protein A4244_08990 [Bacillus badius]MED0666094.1 hypothetical protein [Bacillus badius]OCS83140.1 hypothetical protein A6M11_09000 [Bacillus badius]OVE51516.1 hypothetical protein B1A98_10725 [Bacillus badius]TDW02753.1 hypothetical protein B0G66_10528 [Bacillus badius]
MLRGKKSCDEMSVHELMAELRNLNKKSGFKPRKLKSDANGTLLLDRENKEDQDWYDNDEDYGVLKP